MTNGTLTAAVAVALTAAVLTAAPAQAAPPALALPAPTGDLHVGMSALHLVDHTRADPWVPTEDRELMLSIWYPAKATTGAPAPYMTEGESRTYLGETAPNLPPDLLTTVGTHAVRDAAPLPSRRGRPLVLLSPGFGMPRATLTGLAEDIAGRGYVVAAIGHNYEAYGITFPGGHTTTCAACGASEPARVGVVRAQDTSFVLDRLTAPGSPWRPLIDRDRIAMVGHSAGGFSAVTAMLADPRLKAAVSLDGQFVHDTSVVIDRPVLMLGAEARVPGADHSWDETWAHLTGWRRWITVVGTEHMSFTDLAPLGAQAGMPQQELDGQRAFTITREYTAAFLAEHFGCGDDLLDGPSPAYPEVRFQG